MRRGPSGAGLMQSYGVVPTLPPVGRLIRLAMRFFCQSAGFDKLSQRTRSYQLSFFLFISPTANDFASALPSGAGPPLQLNYVCYTAPVR